MVNKETDAIAFEQIIFFVDFIFFDIPIKKWIFKYRSMGIPHLVYDKVHQVASGNYLYSKNAFDRIKGYEENLGALDAYSFGYKILRSGGQIKIAPHTYYRHRLSLNSYWIRENENNARNLNILFKKYPIDRTKYSSNFTKGIIKESQLLKIIKVFQNNGNN